jgi:C1A family cysteine protease
MSGKESLTIEKIQEEIRNKNAKWTPKQERRLSLSAEEIKYSLGLRKDERALEALRTRRDVININDLIGEFGKARKLAARPQSIDWRNMNGKNCVTSIKDQKGCGSCVAFGTTATLESMVLIEQDKTMDLSEAELFFCGGAGDAGCGTGWWPENAMPYLLQKGLSEESCFPYQDSDIPCNTCSDRDKQAIKIKKHVAILDVNQRKDYLSNIGAMIGCFEVYRDFMSYSNGIYSHVAGEFLGGHCIGIIGYDDNEGCWICKNSWTEGWGESGFFRIAYGECNLDSEYPFWGVMGTTAPTSR